MIFRTILTSAICFLMLASTSCSWLYREEWIDPVVELSSAKLMIVPFSKGEDYWYYEYSEGETLSQAVGIAIKQECSDIDIVTGSRVEERIRTTFDDPMPWRDIGKEFGATHVLFGDVTRLTSVDPHRVGMFSGQLEFTVSIYDVSEGKLILNRHPVGVRFPGNVDEERVIVSFAENLPRLRAELFHKGATEVQKLTCGYYEDKMGN